MGSNGGAQIGKDTGEGGQFIVTGCQAEQGHSGEREAQGRVVLHGHELGQGLHQGAIVCVPAENDDQTEEQG